MKGLKCWAVTNSDNQILMVIGLKWKAYAKKVAIVNSGKVIAGIFTVVRPAKRQTGQRMPCSKKPVKTGRK